MRRMWDRITFQVAAGIGGIFQAYFAVREMKAS